MKRLSSIILATAAIGTASTAFAGSDSGLYLGGSFGQADVDLTQDVPDLGCEHNFDDEDTAYKLYAGYNLGLIPTINLAVEGGYIDFGQRQGNYTAEYEDASVSTDSEIDLTGWTVSGLAGFDLGPVGVFGKVGVIDWDSEVKELSDVGDINTDPDQSGTDPAYGVGAKVQIGSIAVRAEYEQFENDDDDINLYSIGATVTF